MGTKTCIRLSNLERTFKMGFGDWYTLLVFKSGHDGYQKRQFPSGFYLKTTVTNRSLGKLLKEYYYFVFHIKDT